MKRPLLIAACIYSLGIALNSFFTMPFFIVLLVLMLFSLIYFIKENTPIFLVISIVLSIFGIGMTYSHFKFTNETKSLNSYTGNSIHFEAEIISEPDIRENKTVYIVKITNIYYNKIKTKINSKALVSIYNTSSSDKTFEYGNMIEGSGKLSSPLSARNFGGFDYKRYLSSQGIYVTISTLPYNIDCIGKTKLNPIIRCSLFLRQKIIEIIDASLPEEEAGFLNGIVIGERNGLSDETVQAFTISGLSHIVCVSGANIAYVSFACLFFLGLLKISKRNSSILTIIVIIIFTYITGSSASVVRAAIMGIILLLGSVLNRKSDSLNSIATASLLILIYNPFTLYDVGFQLSFGGTIGIVMFYKTLFSLFNRLPKLINEVLSASLAAQLTVNPIVALYFNKLSLIAIVSNIIVVPFTGIATILGFIMSMAGFFSTFLAKLVGGLAYFVLAFMLWVAKISSKIPFASIQVITPSLLFIIFYYVVLYNVLFYIPLKMPSRRYITTFCYFLVISVLFFSISFLTPAPLQLNFLDVGQGDSCFVKTPSGKSILIDGGGTYPGSKTSFDPANTIIPFILDSGKTSVDIAILSHAHNDHIQGIIETVGTLTVKKLIIGPQAEPTPDLEKLIKLCQQKGTEVWQVSKGDTLTIDGVTLNFIYPSKSDLIKDESALNNNSLVFNLNYRGIGALFTGDIQDAAEAKLISESINLDTDILKIPHHGSPYSSSDKFLNAVSPKVSIISVGTNTFGHPSTKVLERIKNVNSLMYRTDKNGGIRINIYDNRFVTESCQ